MLDVFMKFVICLSLLFVFQVYAQTGLEDQSLHRKIKKCTVLYERDLKLCLYRLDVLTDTPTIFDYKTFAKYLDCLSCIKKSLKSDLKVVKQKCLLDKKEGCALFLKKEGYFNDYCKLCYFFEQVDKYYYFYQILYQASSKFLLCKLRLRDNVEPRVNLNKMLSIKKGMSAINEEEIIKGYGSQMAFRIIPKIKGLSVVMQKQIDTILRTISMK